MQLCEGHVFATRPYKRFYIELRLRVAEDDLVAMSAFVGLSAKIAAHMHSPAEPSGLAECRDFHDVPSTEELCLS
jgi:hypothetical protein